MKILIPFLILISFLSHSYGQDTIIRTSQGKVEFTKSGKRNQFEIQGQLWNKTIWLKGKIKKVKYEYMETPRYYGCTQPANPNFYTPVKRITYYYKPIGDFIILHKDSNIIAQTFNLDSSILRTYYETGLPQNVYFCNDLLQIDSIYQYYENGKLKLKQLGNWDAHTDCISFQTYKKASIQPRRYIRPKTEIEFHGSGLPQRRVDFVAKDSSYTSFNREYTMYDVNGIVTEDAYITSDHQWTGLEYKYYKTGQLSNKNYLFRGRPYGECEYWGWDGELIYRKYLRKGYSDSIVFYKKLKDTLLSWKAPIHFKWDRNGCLEKVINKNSCELEFKPDGSMKSYKIGGFSHYAYEIKKDEKFNLTHHGIKDEFGLPHGRWLGINYLNDTLYDINFKHGWLHGNFHVDILNNETSWTKVYDMGIETDSSYHTYKGYINEMIYYSEPGKIVKKMAWYANGDLMRIDTSLNGKTLITLSAYLDDEIRNRITTFDTLNKRISRKSYTVKGELESETIETYLGQAVERLSYHLETGHIHVHWIQLPSSTIPRSGTIEKYDERGEIIESVPKVRRVTHSIRKTYDSEGKLIKEEILKNGSIVE